MARTVVSRTITVEDGPHLKAYIFGGVRRQWNQVRNAVQELSGVERGRQLRRRRRPVGGVPGECRPGRCRRQDPRADQGAPPGRRPVREGPVPRLLVVGIAIFGSNVRR